MSNFYKMTIHPDTGELENAEWLDGYFDGRLYGVRFPGGEIWSEEDIREVHVTKTAVTIPIDLYSEILEVLKKHMFWSEDGEEGNNDDVCELVSKLEDTGD